MSQTTEISSLHVDHALRSDVCRKYSVKELSLFGSAGRGEMRPESAEELEALTGRTADLVARRGLKPWVRPGVLKDACCHLCGVNPIEISTRALTSAAATEAPGG